jgi:LacI family transcriptional regulator
MTTIKDIAQEAQVSRATVSLALNGKPGVAPETRRRILEIAKRLSYQPNASAKGLALQKTETLGIIVPDISSPFYAELVRGVEEEASSKGYHLILCTTAGKLSREEVYLRLLGERRIDGMILVTPREQEEVIRHFREARFPLVIVDRDLPSTDEIIEVVVDNLQGALAAVEHLINLGYREIGFINGLSELQASRDRLRGYQLALQEHGIMLDERWICSGDFQEEGGYRCMQQLLKTVPQLEAVFIASDLMTMGAIRAIRAEGKEVPGDIAVVGFDDIPLSAFFNPPLTTVRQPIARMGALACRLLLQEIRGEEILERKVILRPELVVRASTAPHPSFKKGVIRY